jgi:hypothetical protein
MATFFEVGNELINLDHVERVEYSGSIAVVRFYDADGKVICRDERNARDTYERLRNSADVEKPVPR